MKKFFHPYHLVDIRPWPLTSSLGAFMLTRGLVNFFYRGNLLLTLRGLRVVLLSRVQWWRDVRREGCLQGLHTYKVLQGLEWGIILFIVSEIIFFFSFFWAFFHSSLRPGLELGRTWPPQGLRAIDPFSVPLLNTVILLSSGVTVTWAHHSLLEGDHSDALLSLGATVGLGGYFIITQYLEYFSSRFTLRDSVYGAVFFVATGFHGFHVIVGVGFLRAGLLRLMNGQFRSKHHFGFEAAAWYWHFVDVVWIFLFINIYWWGGQ